MRGAPRIRAESDINTNKKKNKKNGKMRGDRNVRGKRRANDVVEKF